MIIAKIIISAKSTKTLSLIFLFRAYFLYQIKQEMAGALDFLQHIYSKFGFTFQLKLSTRPEKYLGDLDMWNEAEKVS